MATSCVCYNHEESRAVWSCFDCKPDCVIKYCQECHDYVHSLPVFRLHKTESIVLSQGEKRRLSQDVSDLEKLVVVERDILNGVITTLRYVDQQEREMLREIVKKSEKRLHDIQECHEKVDKALRYLAKVSTVIASCSNNAGSEVAPSQFMYREPVKNFKDILQNLADREELGGLPQFPVEIVGSLNKSGCFWMVKRTASDRDKLAQIEHDLREYFKHNPVTKTPLTALKEGAVCAAKNSGNTEFWRVRVDKICTNEMVKLRYLDFGMQEELPLNCIVDLPPSLRTVPFLAMECSLFPLTSQVSLPYEAKWCFKDLTHGIELTASVNSQMIYPQGNSMYHVQLTAVGPPTVNINQKVADMLAQKQQDAEDCPIRLKKDDNKSRSEAPQKPKELEKPKVQPAQEKIAIAQEKLATAQVATAQEKIAHEAKENQVLGNSANDSNKEPEKSMTEQENPPGEPVKKYTILTRNSEDKNQKELFQGLPNLMSVVAEPKLSSLNAQSVASDVPNEKTFEQSHSQQTNANAAQGTNEQKTEKAKDAEDFAKKPQDTFQDKLQTTVPEYIPIGFLNEQMFKDLVDEHSNTDWHAVRAAARKAKFYITKGNVRQMIEALKTNIWCVLDEHFAAHLNQVYKDQTERQTSVFLVLLQKGYIIGLVRIVSERRPIPHCSLVMPGILWGRECRAEFKIEVLSINKYKFHRLDCESYLWSLFSDNCIAKELRFEMAQEIIFRYEHLRLQFTILEWGYRQYSNMQQTAPPKGLMSSQENISALPHERYLHDSVPMKARGSQESFTEGENQNKEDWEPDLQAQPAKVAEIYSNISGSDVGIESHSEDDRPDDQREDEDTIQEDKKSPEVSTESKETGVEGDVASNNVPVELNEGLNDKTNDENGIVEVERETPEKITNGDNDFKNTDALDSNLVTSQPKQKQESSEQFEKSDQKTLQLMEESEPSCRDEHSNYQAHPAKVSTIDEQLPSSMLYGQETPSNNDNTDASLKDQSSLPQNIQQEAHENFYHVLSPPQTPQADIPSTIEPKMIVQEEKVEILKEEQEELPSKESPSIETEPAATKSSTSLSSLTNEACSSSSSRASPDLLQVAECTHIDSDADGEESFLPVEKGGRYNVFAWREPDEEGNFWARLVRNDKEEEVFMNLNKTLLKLARTSEPIEHVHLFKHCLFVPAKGHIQRCLITKLYDEKVDVRLIDIGKVATATLKELRELGDEYVACMPPQAFECKLRVKNAIKEKLKKTKKSMKSFELEIEVTSLIGEVVEVDVIGIRLSDRGYRYYKPPSNR